MPPKAFRPNVRIFEDASMLTKPPVFGRPGSGNSNAHPSSRNLSFLKQSFDRGAAKTSFDNDHPGVDDRTDFDSISAHTIAMPEDF